MAIEAVSFKCDDFWEDLYMAAVVVRLPYRAAKAIGIFVAVVAVVAIVAVVEQKSIVRNADCEKNKSCDCLIHTWRADKSLTFMLEGFYVMWERHHPGKMTNSMKIWKFLLS